MTHDPKAQDVIAAHLADTYGWLAEVAANKTARDQAGLLLDALADAGLCVVSDAAEPSDQEGLF